MRSMSMLLGHVSVAVYLLIAVAQIVAESVRTLGGPQRACSTTLLHQMSCTQLPNDAGTASIEQLALPRHADETNAIA
jgi:hypothetical protein